MLSFYLREFLSHPAVARSSGDWAHIRVTSGDYEDALLPKEAVTTKPLDRSIVASILC